MVFNPGQVILVPTITQSRELVRFLGLAPYQIYSLNTFVEKFLWKRKRKQVPEILLELAFWDILKKRKPELGHRFSTAASVLQEVRSLERLDWRALEAVRDVANATCCKQEFEFLTELLNYVWELEDHLGHETFVRSFFQGNFSKKLSPHSIRLMGFSQFLPWEAELLGLNSLSPNSIHEKMKDGEILHMPFGEIKDYAEPWEMGFELSGDETLAMVEVQRLMASGLSVYAPDSHKPWRDVKVLRGVSQAIVDQDWKNFPELGQIWEEIRSFGVGLAENGEMAARLARMLPTSDPSFYDPKGIRVYPQERIPTTDLKLLVVGSDDVLVSRYSGFLPLSFWSEIHRAELGALPGNHPELLKRSRSIRRNLAQKVVTTEIPTAKPRRKEIEKFSLDLGNKLSVSDIVEYWRCPTRLYARKKNLVPERPEALVIEPGELGTEVHRIIEDVTRKRISGDIEAFHEIKHLALNEVELVEPKSRRQEVKRVIERWLGLEEKIFGHYVPLEVEKDFNIVWEDWNVRGRIDRIDVGPDGEVIWDYKTGNPEVTPQLYLYLLSRPEAKFAGIFSLSQSSFKGPWREKSNQVEKFQNTWSAELSSVAEGLKLQDFQPRPRTRYQCAGCPGRGVCGQ